MNSLLFHIMSGTDLDWLLTVAKTQPVEPNQIIPSSDNTAARYLYLVLGPCAIAMPHQHPENLKELIQLSTDGCVGEMPGLESCFSTARLQATVSCPVLSIDVAQLNEKLIEDTAFAAHFYQFQAVLVMQYLKALIQQFNLNPLVLYQINVKEASSLFAELQDSHLDWCITVGQRRQLVEGSVLQRANRPIESLQIVLEGALSLNSLMPSKPSSNEQPVAQEIARLGRGDIFGEMRSLQSIGFSSMPVVQVKAERDTEILSIPYWRIFSKVLHDEEFALHYYRTLAHIMASKYHTILSELGFLTQHTSQRQLSDPLLEKVAKAEANFEWMVQRIQSKVIIGREIEWSCK
ncbi:MAG: cyclic nucleotide-binding domain-containing protein [Leptolyngbyaceae cyanobacterium bins.349]|nr:cyclic nucleotide-binding domain-containing protein [Leptolyngbyaceae cyanobacterium bins.349]